MKRIFAFVLVLLMFCPVTVYANSAPTRWRGTDANSIIITDDGCPVTVQKEVLTFNIESMPTEYYSTVSDYKGDHFVAEYTLHNPTDMDITATVLFPFGKKGDYYDETYLYGRDFVKDNYKVEIDGQEIDAQKRYTFYPYSYNEFDIDRQAAKINDKYAGDEFFYPEQKVTMYEINLDMLDENDKISLTWKGKNDGAVLVCSGFPESTYQNDTLYLTLGNGSWLSMGYYIIGDGENRPDVKIVNEENPTGISADYVTTAREMTLREFIKNHGYTDFYYFDVPQTDFDNIVSDIFTSRKEQIETMNFVDYMHDYNIPSALMCWYKYDITIPAGGTVVNTVTAPLFPDVNTGYEPDIFTYNYLLSPAGRWADFKNLEIIINTPYRVTQSSVDFEKTQTGYKSTFDTLPNKELAFTISESQKPQKETDWRYLPFILPVFILPVFVIIGIVIILKIRKSK